MPDLSATSWKLQHIAAASPAFALIALLLLAFARLGGGRWFPHVMAVLGLIVAASWLDPRKAIVLAATLAPNWLVVRLLWGKPGRAKAWIVGPAVAWHVAVLSSTKIVGVSGEWGIAGVIGLSYITFRQIQMVVEAPRARAALSSVMWLSFMINPLTLIAGPIQTWRKHREGAIALAPPDYQASLKASHRIVTGLLKILVVAPIFAGQSDFSQMTPGTSNLTDWLVTFYSYYIFLFLDFSGYIDVVFGLAILFGFNTFPENFNRPYFAVNFQDFWNRWNMSLGVWFRTFLFTPLLATFTRSLGAKRQNTAIVISLFLTFFVIGLWHGLGWNFVVFGVIQAIGVSLTHLIRQGMIQRFGRAGYEAYDRNAVLKPVRILLFQHLIAGSFLLLDNDVLDIWKVLFG